jgi:hypothetical protein
MKRCAVFLLTGLLAGPLLAHPVSYKGALSLMSWNQADETETMLTYTLQRNIAVASVYHRMILEDGSEVKYYGPQLNYLLRRWNGDDHQANIYVFGGAGAHERNSRNRSAGLAGVEADYETTKVYFSSKFMSIYPELGDNHYSARYRAGVSAFPFEFDTLAAWAIIDVQHNPQMKHAVTFTPVLRLFYRNVLLEAGSSFNGDLMLNFMVHLYPGKLGKGGK